MVAAVTAAWRRNFALGAIAIVKLATAAEVRCCSLSDLARELEYQGYSLLVSAG